MSSIKGPPRGNPPANTPEQSPAQQRDLADQINHSAIRQPTALQMQERQAQNAQTLALGRGKKDASAADAERLISQAGYLRTGAKKKNKNFDVGDSAQSPIPLPIEDSEDAQWSQSSLQEAQTALMQQGSAFFEAAKHLPEGADLEALWQRVLSERYSGDEATHTLQMQAVMQGASLEQQAASLNLAQISQSASAMFGVELGNAEPGAALVAAALMVAGASEAVVVVPGNSGAKDSLEPSKLAGGVQNVVTGGHTAVEDARKMNQGIDKNLSMHRTFVFKR